MRGIRYRRRAQNDLDSIFDYTRDRWGGAQARAYVRRIVARIEDVAADRIVAQRVDDLAISHPSLRRIKSGRHIAFFVQETDTLFVVRILHERMAWAEALNTPDP